MADLTLKNRDIWQALIQTDAEQPGALVRLAKLDVPIAVSNQIRKIIRKAKAELETIDESRKELVEKYAVKDADGKNVERTDGRGVSLTDEDAFVKEFNALLDEDVTLADVRKLTIAEFGTVRVSAEVLDMCDAFLIDS
jgi:predicted methyltransferase